MVPDLNTYKKLQLMLVISLISVWSCSNNSTGTSSNGGSNGGNNNGNSDTYFARNIEPIFNGSCGGTGCHIPGPTSGVSLGNYNDVINSTGVQYGQKIINAGNAANSPIIDKISSANPSFGVRMPKGGNPLSQSQIDTLKSWINRGANENS
jgi:hypothetical protein